MQKSDYETSIAAIQRKFRQKDYRTARTIALNVAREFPDRSHPRVLAALCRSHTGPASAAISELRRLLQQFPDDAIVEGALGDLYQSDGKQEKSELWFSRAVQHQAKEDGHTRGLNYNGWGCALWSVGRKDEALDAWRAAVIADPKNKSAAANLKEFTNEFGEAKRVGPMNDVGHFQNILLKRYLEGEGKEHFENMKEVERVMGAIMGAWNTHIAPMRNRIDAMTAAEKTELFSSVQVDFDKPVKLLPIGLPEEPEDDDLEEDEREFLEETDRQFPFLPPGGGAALLMFGIPLLIEAGVSKSEMKRLTRGAPPRKGYQKLIEWGFRVISVWMDVLDARSAKKKKQSRDEALKIAGERLDPVVADRMLNAMKQIFDTMRSDATAGRSSSKKKPR